MCPHCRARLPETDEQAVKLEIKRAEQGCSWWQFMFGHDYEEGDGVNVDMYKDVHAYHRSAEQRHTMAQYIMGLFHWKGLGGCDQSDAVAEKFYTLAAAKNESRAQLNLAHLMKKNGRYTEALQWATLSAHGGCPDSKAECFRASLYYGADTEGIIARDLYWRRKAAMAGDKESFCCVAHLIMEFNIEIFGVAEVGEYGKALYWYRQGALWGCEIEGK